MSLVTSSTSSSSTSTMISQFWSLCRACPSMDIDKVSSIKKEEKMWFGWELVVCGGTADEVPQV